MASLITFPQLAALSIALNHADQGVIQVFPSGDFRATDGRPEDVDTWRMDADIAAALIERFALRRRRLVIDYEHQTLAATTNGQPAPAAGWITGLEWRDGQGVYARVEWTSRASTYIAAEEYLYISPVFSYDKDGRPLELFHAALTNDPALGGMDEVRLAAASQAAHYLALNAARNHPNTKEDDMSELLKALYRVLGLAEDATEEEAIEKLNEFVQAAATTATEVAELTAEVEEKTDEVAALKARTGKTDPARFVPISAMTELHTQVAALTRAQAERDVDSVVMAALTANKLTPGMESWARELGSKDLPALKTYLTQVAPIAALSSTQTGNHSPFGQGNQLTADEIAVCKKMGLDQAAYLKHRT